MNFDLKSTFESKFIQLYMCSFRLESLFAIELLSVHKVLHVYSVVQITSTFLMSKEGRISNEGYEKDQNGYQHVIYLRFLAVFKDNRYEFQNIINNIFRHWNRLKRCLEMKLFLTKHLTMMTNRKHLLRNILQKFVSLEIYS